MSDITRSEAIKTLKEHLSHWERLLQEHICEEQEGIDTISALKLAIASLETDEAYQLEYEQPEFCKDCISRSDVLKLMQDNWHTHNGDWAMQESMDDIRALPAVTPIRPTGHWINKDYLFNSCSAECSSCHKRSNGYQHDNGFSLDFKYYDFCPNCGSDNREVEDGND